MATASLYIRLPSLYPEPGNTNWKTILIVAVLMSAYVVLMYMNQGAIPVDSLSWDSYTYYHMALGEKHMSGFPLPLRIGLPWVAGHFPTDNVHRNFVIINTACAMVYLVLCIHVLCRAASGMHFMAPVIACWFVCASNTAPVPGVFWYPAQTDVACSLLALVFLAMVMSGRFYLPAVVAVFFVGTTVRENFPEFLVFSLLQFRFVQERGTSLVVCIKSWLRDNADILTVQLCALGATCVAFQVIYLYTGLNPAHDKITMMVSMANSYLQSPAKLLSIMVNTASPLLLVLAACQWKTIRPLASTPVSRHPATPVVIVALSLVALFGGTNPERYWSWGVVFISLCALPFIDALLQHRQYLLLGLVLSWSAFIQRSFVPIDTKGFDRECDLVSILTGQSNWLGHWSDRCDTTSQLHLVYLACLVFFATWLVARLTQSVKAQHVQAGYCTQTIKSV